MPTVKKLHGAIAGTGSSSQEALLGLASGLAFGLVTPIVGTFSILRAECSCFLKFVFVSLIPSLPNPRAGHPGDVIKTQLQANAAHRDFSTSQAIRHIYQTQGLAGFYRGFFPPLLGTALTRGVLFSTYSGVYSACSHSRALSDPLPFTAGLAPSVVLGGIAGGTARAVVETPLEFIKVRAIVAQSSSGTAGAGTLSVSSAVRSLAASPAATARSLYRGFVPTLLRSIGVCGSFFVLVDYSVRYLPDVVNAPTYGAFFKGGVCATAAWTLAFPFETAKSVIQADAAGRYNNMSGATVQVLRDLYRERGLVRGWYRGFVPGAGRSFVANGCSMMVYSWFQDAIRSHFDDEP
jgi:solute carrier family 25 carnitine/acylcarnitine transporter 20/29